MGKEGGARGRKKVGGWDAQTERARNSRQENESQISAKHSKQYSSNTGVTTLVDFAVVDFFADFVDFVVFFFNTTSSSSSSSSGSDSTTPNPDPLLYSEYCDCTAA